MLYPDTFSMRQEFGRKTKLLLLAAVFGLLLSLFLMAFNAPTARAAGFSVDTKNIRFGQQISVSGSGFSPNEPVAIWDTDSSGVAATLGRLFADNLGNFSGFSPVYKYGSTGEDAPGTIAVTAKGINSGTTLTDTFTLAKPTLSSNAVSVAVDGTPLVISTFAGNNYYPGEKISIWITDGAGKVLGLGYCNADGGGKMPNDPISGLFFAGTPGAYKLSVNGNTSGQTIVADLIAR